MPRVSVIVPCFNDGELLARAVGSIRESEPVELVIVDDGSEDAETVAVLEQLEERGVRVLRHAHNRGVSAARMTGLEATSAELVMPLDADDLAIPYRLGEMADLLGAEAGAAACLGDYVEFGSHLLVRAVPVRLDPYRLAYTNEYPPSAMFRRSALEGVGGWRAPRDEIDSRSDWGLWLSLAQAGHEIIHLGPGRLLYCYRIHGERLQARGRRFHRKIYGALRDQHPHLFSDLRRHRSRSSMSPARRLAYPLLYGRRTLRTRRLEGLIKRTLDRAGVWTLQRPLPAHERRRLVDLVAALERAAVEAGSGTGPLPAVGSPRREDRRISRLQVIDHEDATPIAATAGSREHAVELEGRSPIIVIGASRSGTALATRILEQLGAFMGARQDENAESVHFIGLNTWLLTKAGASWDEPSPLFSALRDESFRALARERFASRLAGWSARKYFGRIGAPGSDMRSIDVPWGWKDPRTSFTLPVWLDLFPDARVVHVLRHGVDVAASHYRVQEERSSRALFLWRAASRRGFDLPTIARELLIYARRPDASTTLERFSGIDSAMRLWSESVEVCERAAADLGDQLWAGRFEDLMTDAKPWIGELAEFCGIEAHAGQISQAVELVRSERRFAFRSDPALLALAERYAPELAVRGYGPGGFSDRAR